MHPTVFRPIQTLKYFSFSLTAGDAKFLNQMEEPLGESNIDQKMRKEFDPSPLRSSRIQNPPRNEKQTEGSLTDQGGEEKELLLTTKIPKRGKSSR
jgi:hypothetical protein